MDPGDATFTSECDWSLFMNIRKVAKLMVKHNPRNLTYSATLQSFGASPTMKTFVGVRRSLKKLHALKNIDLI